MKKSKLTGTLAVGGGLKHAVVPYIIIGEENNGYSKGDILDANYVKQLINDNAIPDDIQANTLTLTDTLTLNSGKILTNGGFGVSDKETPWYNNLSITNGSVFCSYYGRNYMYFSPEYSQIYSDDVIISGNNNEKTNLSASLNYINLNLNGNNIYIDDRQMQFPSGVIQYANNKFSFAKYPQSGVGDGDGIYLLPNYITISGSKLQMQNSTEELIQYYSKDGSGQYKDGDVAFYWKAGNLFLNKIYKPTQTISGKDLFERVSDLETPKKTREDNPKVGQCVFDTTLGKPIWCKIVKIGSTAAVWVDATGATV